MTNNCEYLWKCWDLNFSTLHSLTRIDNTSELYKTTFDESTENIRNLQQKINFDCKCDYCFQRSEKNDFFTKIL